jgi:hypothetical protein
MNKNSLAERRNIMRINAIYCINTSEILYSRSNNDYRQSSDKRCAIDGGLEYCRIIGNPEDFIQITLDGDYLLEFMLSMDYKYGNSMSVRYPDGYYGRFEIKENSNLEFYRKLILNYDDVEKYFYRIGAR